MAEKEEKKHKKEKAEETKSEEKKEENKGKLKPEEKVVVLGKEEIIKEDGKKEKIVESKLKEKKEIITEQLTASDNDSAKSDSIKITIKSEEKAIPKEEFKEIKEEKAGIVYIFSSPNNTIVHITDLSGNTISRVSGGMITKHSRLKADPTIAMFVAKKAAERAKDLGINALYVRTRAKTNSEGLGVGPGAHSAVKSLDREGFKIINVLDATRVPRGGPKKKGGRRGRRV